MIPYWIKEKKKISTQEYKKIKGMLENYGLHTVCQEARCPNIYECFKSGTATFLILGNICTRNCRFCAIKKGVPQKVDPLEPNKVADCVYKMGIDFAVITSVTRDDLEDGGASHFVKTMKKIREKKKDIKIEILIPDFKGNMDALNLLLEEKPDVLNHNVETVKRLYPEVRPLANYELSLKILKFFADNNIITKSGFMVGLGETLDEIIKLMEDLREAGVQILTIGQYLRPTMHHLPVKKYYHPDEFEKLKEIAYNIGFKFVVSGPFVRSSYRAKEAYFSCSTI